MHSEGPVPEYLRLGAATDRSGLSRSRLYVLMAAGKIRAKKDGGKTLIEWASVSQFLNALPAATFGAAREISA